MSWLSASRPEIEVITTNTETTAADSSGGIVSLLRNEFSHMRELRRLYDQALRMATLDAVLLPFGDYILHACALRGSPFARTPWTTIIMRPSFHYRASGINAPHPSFASARFRLFQSFVATESLRSCITVDEALYDFMRGRPRMQSKAVYLPEPVETIARVDSSAARMSLGIPLNATVVLVYGQLSTRKGLTQLFRALRFSARSDIHLLAVGQADQTFATCLQSDDAGLLRRESRLHVFEGWCDQARERDAFAAADIAWLGYVGHWRSSGVLAQTGRYGLPIVACDEGLIGWTTAKYQCGLVIPISNIEAVVQALATLADSPELRKDLASNGIRAFARNSVENAGSILAGCLV